MKRIIAIAVLALSTAAFAAENEPKVDEKTPAAATDSSAAKMDDKAPKAETAKAGHAHKKGAKAKKADKVEKVQ